MCGRTACTKASGEIADACTYRSKNNAATKPQWKNVGSTSYKPSYNNGPKSCAPILLKNRLPADENEERTERIILPMQWGLVPSWHKGDPKNFSFNMINCRCDTLTEKKSFLKALEKGQRCIVLADGFYEWDSTAGKEKQAYYIQLKDGVKPHMPSGDQTSKQMLTMAALFDKHVSAEEGELYTYSIITVESSSSFKWLHHRMPAILESEEAVEKWLDVDTVPYQTALDLLVATDSLTWYPVSSLVNNVRNNSMECIKKIDLAKEAAKKSRSGNLMSMWLKKGEKRKEEEDTSPSSKKTKT